MFGQLSVEEIEDVLKNQLLGRIGCHLNDTTYIVPVCYAYDGACIYARTYEGLKINMMRENPKVCFEVESIESMVDWKTVVCQGVYEELTEKPKRDKGIQILHERVIPLIANKTLRLSAQWPFSETDSGNLKGIIFCIHLNEKTGKFEKDDYYLS
jgi:nitroimidazol reductase NimA-like FMN-containing flavoprotein (pyridoxamine 5'-phosphate oxidase superfamily)